MQSKDNQNQKNKIFAIAICLLIFSISSFINIQSSIIIDAFYWIISLVLVAITLSILIPKSAHSYLLFSVLSILITGVGVYEFASVLLWLSSAWGLGRLVLEKIQANKNPSLIKNTEAVLIGSAIWLAIWGLMMHFAINYQKLHIALCLLPCIMFLGRLSSIFKELRSKAYTAETWMRSIPLWAWFAGLTVIGWVLRWTSFPSMGYDDHSLHLRVWTKLLTQHYYDFDVNTQIWSVAPFVVDLLHAGLSLMAGYDARGAMNLALALFLLLLIGKILYLWKLSIWAQWLLVVLMASTPMLGNLLLSLQTELALAVLAIAGISLLIDDSANLSKEHALAMIACAALCAGVKLPGAVLGITLLIALSFRLWRECKTLKSKSNSSYISWPAFLLLIPIGFVAIHSYVLAWILTGNPVFPLYNAIFLSPYYDQINFKDSRWIHGFSFISYFRAFFHTSKFFESGDFTAGWQYLFLLPAAIIAGLRSTAPNNLRATLIPLFGFGFLMFSATQYWRYLFPIMPIAGILFATLFIETNRVYQTSFAALAIVCIVLNLAFFPRISWMMNSPPKSYIKNDEQQTLAKLYAPAALLTETINKYAPNSRVLYPHETPYGATLYGTPIYINWYSPLRAKKFFSLKTKEDVKNFLSEEKPDFIITNINDDLTPNSPTSLLREHLAEFGTAMLQEGSFILYRISEIPLIYHKEFELSSYTKSNPGEVDFYLHPFKESVHASQEPKELVRLKTYRAKQARYSVEFSCPSENGFFIAQINWNKGNPYYRLVACKAEKTLFSESIPIPVGTTSGTVYITARDTESIIIKNLSVEFH